MTSGAKYLCALGLACVLASAPFSARASKVEYDFSGICTDCTGTAAAQLVLQNYIPGTSLAAANFVRFTYDGTNLLRPYTITVAELSGVSGAVPTTLPPYAMIGIYGNSELFFSGTGGAWCTGVGGGCMRDQGTAGVWSVAPRPIPEPISLALLLPALTGLVLLRYNRTH